MFNRIIHGFLLVLLLSGMPSCSDGKSGRSSTSKLTAGDFTSFTVFHSGSGWRVGVNADGSGVLAYGSSFGDVEQIGQGTFVYSAKFDSLIVESEPLQTKAGVGSAPPEGAKFTIAFNSKDRVSHVTRYLRDGKLVAPLFKTALEVSESRRLRDICDQYPLPQ